MSKMILALITCGFAVLPRSARSQTAIVTLTEQDDDGGREAVDTSTRAGIVDINSIIRIYIDGAELRRRTAAMVDSGEALGELIARLQTLQQISQDGLAALPTAGVAFGDWAQTPRDTAVMKQVQTALQPIGELIFAIDAIAPPETPLGSRIEAAFEGLPPGVTFLDQTKMVFELVADEAESIRASVDEVLRANGVYVQLGAWIVDRSEQRPIHLPGFDEYPEGQFFEVDRWHLPFTEEHQAQLEQVTAQAREMRERQADIVSDLRPAAAELISTLAKEARTCIEGVTTTFTNLPSVPGSLLGTVNEAGIVLGNYATFLDRLIRSYDPQSDILTQDPFLLVAMIPRDLKLLAERTEQVKTSLEGIAEAVAEQSVPIIAATRQAIQETVRDCRTVLEVSIGTLTDQVGGVLAILQATDRINTAELEFSEEVLQFDIDAVPNDTHINLKMTGERSEGSHVVLRLAAGRTNRDREVLEEHQLRLYRVLTYLDFAVGLIFADPLGDTDVTNRFQPGPSYNILLRWGSRGSSVYNRLFKVGIGITVAALDFNKDDNFEFAVGAVLSTLLDYVQVGVGYNVPQDVAFWFFGLRLPLPSPIPLGGAGAETTSQNRS